jgi:hypothetical protein
LTRRVIFESARKKEKWAGEKKCKILFEDKRNNKKIDLENKE